MRIATFNVKHCESDISEADVERTARAAAVLDADIVAMQELDVNLERSDRVHQPERLALLLEMHLFWIPAIAIRGGEYGNALLSRYRIDGGIVKLPKDDAAREPRCAFAGRTAGLSVVATHLTTNPQVAQRQLEVLVETSLALPAPRVILGDLNLRPESLAIAHAGGFRSAAALPTYPRDTPNRQIDHILISDDLVSGAADAPLVGVSDHRPLVVDLEVETSAGST